MGVRDVLKEIQNYSQGGEGLLKELHNYKKLWGVNIYLHEPAPQHNLRPTPTDPNENLRSSFM